MRGVPAPAKRARSQRQRDERAALQLARQVVAQLKYRIEQRRLGGARVKLPQPLAQSAYCDHRRFPFQVI
jgi:hypothetical protein